MRCPAINETAIVTDDPYLAASLSCVLARKQTYLPILDGPRMTRPDRRAEVVRRTNGLARARARSALIGGMPGDALAALRAALPKRLVTEVDMNCVELFAHDEQVLEAPRLKWGRHRLGQGLLKALYSGQLLEFDDRDSPVECIPPKQDHLVVCEVGESLSEVIAANYAFSLGAGLHLLNEVSEVEAKDLLEALYSIDEPDRHPREIRTRIARRFRELCGDFKIPNCGSLTFVTRALPFGAAYPEVPSTHLFAYPDLGLQIVNGFAAEQNGARGTNVAVLVDPEKVRAPEIETATELLPKRGFYVRGYKGPIATVRAVTEMLDWFPYDLLIFATHCADAPGYRWTYEYLDSEGLDRTLVVDIAVSFARTDDPEMFAVTQFVRFHSLDGVDWTDNEAKEKLYVGTAIKDYSEWSKGERLKPTKKEDIERVRGSAVMAMADGAFMPMSQQLAARGSPIIINNACVSWHELASRLTFANARAYIGTLFSVSDAEAEAFLVSFLGKNFGKPLAHASWSAQNAVYGDDGGDRRPYVVTGVYPQRLRNTKEDTPRHIYQRMHRELKDCEEEVDALRKDANDHHYRTRVSQLNYYRAEIPAFYERWIAPRNRGQR